MTDGEALLATIIAKPDEDTPRLVYADWLDENGQPERANAIRSMPPGRDPDRWVMPYALIILGCAPPDSLALTGWGCAVASCRFGFIETLECSAADWLRFGDAIRAAHPVTRVRLTTWPGALSNAETGWKLYDGTSYETRRPGRFLADHAPDEPDNGFAAVAQLLELEWPGVAFELPAGVEVEALDAAGSDFEDFNRQLQADIVRALSIPPGVIDPRDYRPAPLPSGQPRPRD